MWTGLGANPQHTGLSPWATQPLDSIHWQAPVDMNPAAGYAHYGSPVITAQNTIIVPVKTGTNGGFELIAYDGGTGAQKWTINSDYALPAHDWMPPFGPALTSDGVLVFPGAHGTVYTVANPDSNGATITSQLAFYNSSNYGAYAGIQIDTPITADAAGNIYFGFVVSGANPSNITGGGLARISSTGQGSWVTAAKASGDAAITKVAYACAPAMSADGSTVYVSVNNSNDFHGYLLAVSSTTLATQDKVFLKDPRNGKGAGVLDDSTSTPLVGPDGSVFYGVMGNPYNGSRGFLLHFSADLSQSYAPAAFGWDDTPSIVPTSMVPEYHGTSSYLIFLKYNNYVAAEVGATGGSGANEVAILDPYATQPDTRNDSASNMQVMNEVLVMPGPTADTDFTSQGYADAVREWCIDDTVVDPNTNSVLVNSEDGNIYRWDLPTNTLSQGVMATMGVGEPYTPTLVGPDGTIYAINGGTIFAMGGYQAYTLTEVSSANPAALGQAVKFTTTVANTSASEATPTGSVKYMEMMGMSSVLLANVRLTNGVATFTPRTLSLGNHFIMAEYSGDSTHPAGSAMLVESVRYGETTSLTSSLNPAVVGDAVTFTMTVTPAAGAQGKPSGKVVLLDGSTLLEGADLSNGQATFTVSTLSVGTHQIRVQYSGDIHFVPGSSTLTEVINDIGPPPPPPLPPPGGSPPPSPIGPPGGGGGRLPPIGPPRPPRGMPPPRRILPPRPHLTPPGAGTGAQPILGAPIAFPFARWQVANANLLLPSLNATPAMHVQTGTTVVAPVSATITHPPAAPLTAAESGASSGMQFAPASETTMPDPFVERDQLFIAWHEGLFGNR